MTVRLAYFAVGAVLGVVLGTAVMVIHADEVEAIAAEANVDPQDLRGAMNTTRLGPREYLEAVGELAVSTGGASVSPAHASPGLSPVWTRLAQCESTGRWGIANPPYYGGLQFDLPTWRAYGGLGYAPRPDLASPSAQIAVAERLRASRGFAPWPACSRALGLR